MHGVSGVKSPNPASWRLFVSLGRCHDGGSCRVALLLPSFYLNLLRICFGWLLGKGFFKGVFCWPAHGWCHLQGFHRWNAGIIVLYTQGSLFGSLASHTNAKTSAIKLSFVHVYKILPEDLHRVWVRIEFSSFRPLCQSQIETKALLIILQPAKHYLWRQNHPRQPRLDLIALDPESNPKANIVCSCWQSGWNNWIEA